MDLTTDMETWRVLVVDDEPDNLLLVSDLLEYGGAEVFLAQEGRAGLVMVDEVHPNLILLDLAMPEMDGWEMHRILRSRPDTRDLPIIALTALAMPSDADRVREEGFSAHITKPFRVRALISDIQDCIKWVTGADGK